MTIKKAAEILAYLETPIANAAIDCLAHPKKYEKLRKAARESIVKNYDLKTVCLPKQIKILRDFIKKPL